MLGPGDRSTRSAPHGRFSFSFSSSSSSSTAAALLCPVPLRPALPQTRRQPPPRPSRPPLSCDPRRGGGGKAGPAGPAPPPPPPPPQGRRPPPCCLLPSGGGSSSAVPCGGGAGPVRGACLLPASPPFSGVPSPAGFARRGLAALRPLKRVPRGLWRRGRGRGRRSQGGRSLACGAPAGEQPGGDGVKVSVGFLKFSVKIFSEIPRELGYQQPPKSVKAFPELSMYGRLQT
ncbi:formin-A-like [Accipiter gentilis]|uniref:formin-A-like n=1 Tax=Astur gentilis TaxID=8957 RepID=UPI00210FCF5E|nr:formin-A-like [Accipiter gentilis]